MNLGPAECLIVLALIVLLVPVAAMFGQLLRWFRSRR
jgi:hypothetical protein